MRHVGIHRLMHILFNVSKFEMSHCLIALRSEDLFQCYVWNYPAWCRSIQGQPYIPVACEEQALCM